LFFRGSFDLSIKASFRLSSGFGAAKVEAASDACFGRWSTHFVGQGLWLVVFHTASPLHSRVLILEQGGC
jgi:hypothetical protein